MPPRRQTYARGAKRQPETLESLNALIGEARKLGIPVEQIRECLRRMGYAELRQLPRHEYSLFAGWIEGAIYAAGAAKTIDDFILFSNGVHTSQPLERRGQVKRSEHNQTQRGKPEMSITMTINASFGTVQDWTDFLKRLSILGFADQKPEHHGLIGKAHGGEHHHHHGSGHHRPEAAGEQNVNTPEHKHEEEPKPRKGRPPKAEKHEHTQESLNALIGEAKKAGIEVPHMRKLLQRLGSDSFANLPEGKYGDFAALLHDEIATAKAEAL